MEFVRGLWQGCNALEVGVVTFSHVGLYKADSGLSADKSRE